MRGFTVLACIASISLRIKGIFLASLGFPLQLCIRLRGMGGLMSAAVDIGRGRYRPPSN